MDQDPGGLKTDGSGFATLPSGEFYWERWAGVQGKGESKKEAKEAAAKAMLQQIGPYIEDEEWVKYVHSIKFHPVSFSQKFSYVNLDPGLFMTVPLTFSFAQLAEGKV
jgi:hypothetical protein